MIKRWFKNWVGITELEKRNKTLLLRLELHRTHMAKVEKRAIEAEETARFMKAFAEKSAEKSVSAQARVEKLADLFVVGLDYSPSGYDKSWVVVCIRGKMERVQFMDVTDKDAKYIQDFLKMFNRDNVTVDWTHVSFI